MTNRKKTKPKRKSVLPPKYNVGIPNPYTRGSQIHKLWELVIQHPEKIRFRNSDGHSYVCMREEDFIEMRKTYELIGVTSQTMADLWPPVALRSFAPYEHVAADYHYTFNVHMPKKHYQLFHSLRTHCLNLKNGDYTSMTGLEYGNT